MIWFSGWIGIYAQTMQRLIMGDPGTVTRNDLGHLDGNPRFRPPSYDRANDISHGIAPGGKYSRGQERDND